MLKSCPVLDDSQRLPPWLLFHEGKGWSTGAQFSRYSVGSGSAWSQETHRRSGCELVMVRPVIAPGSDVGSGVAVGSGVGVSAGSGVGVASSCWALPTTTLADFLNGPFA